MRFGDRPEDAGVAANWRRDVLAGLRQGGLIAALVLAAVLLVAPIFGIRPWQRHAPAALPVAQAPVAPPLVRRLDFGGLRAPNDVTRVAAWAVREADNGDHAFAIVDKRRAQVYVFAPGGRLLGTSRVLLGYAVGDLSVAGIGHKAIEDIKPQERTTPAGRFESTPGHNTLDQDVVWVDYEAAVSMHRVRATDPRERRLERLATPTSADKRISWGCINVPIAFFDQIVWPNLGHGRGVVYVLPERHALASFFPGAVPLTLAQALPRRSNSAGP
jgi:hypothetical protein